ncbi:cell division protein FtsZ [Rhizobium wenxiniae]|uniref:cell division protein FtsZ n=1 Tax=Rhizobium wenxiniae TaxID=1737357 RepID=UPI001C6F586E|nr:cell division protein FtsZ [Rhizobium wenxiniae]MBW9089810.1 cell division protein FtsZ [Rhizobium wenxiniae]
MMNAQYGMADQLPKITVIGVGGGGGNAVDNMIAQALAGVEFLAANTDAQALVKSLAPQIVQLGPHLTEGLGAGSLPDIGRAAAEESMDNLMGYLTNADMLFLAGGMGGGTGTGAMPVIARAARAAGILTVAVVTEPFVFEGSHRLRQARAGTEALVQSADTVIVVPNQSLFRLSNPHTTLADAFAMADAVLHAGVSSVVDLILKEGIVNLDFSDVRAVMHGMGRAIMSTGEAGGPDRAAKAAKAAVENPLFGDAVLSGARGVLVSVSAGRDLALHEVDEAASRIRETVDSEAEIIFGAVLDPGLGDTMRVSIVATGLQSEEIAIGRVA